MPIVLVGLNHSTAPVDLRERLSLANDGLYIALEELHIHHHSDLPGTGQAQMAESVPVLLHEVVILSTCNRLEVYAVCDERPSAYQYWKEC